MHGERSEPTLRYCANCGARMTLEDTFCGNCGARLWPEPEGTFATREAPRPVGRESARGYALPGLGSRGLGRDALLGVLIGVACAGLLVGALYALLALRGAFSDPSTPGTLGLALFALLHGGASTVEAPPIPALLGLGGTLRLGLPVTSFALLPFVASLILGRLLAPRARRAAAFVLAAALAYALLVAVLAAFGGASVDAGGATVRFAPGPLSTAWRAFLWVVLGTMLGTAAAHGPFLPARPRQVLRGALWAVGGSVAVTLVLTVTIALAQQGLGASTPQATGDASQTIPYGSTLGDGLAGVGAIFALLPAGLGTLWLLAHGVPVGFQNAPDLGGIPLVGEALADVPLRVSLIADWPWGDAWRLLLLAPIVGLVLGGRVAARGAPQADRWWQGAAGGLAYAVIVILTALLVGLTADLTVDGAASIQAAFRASLAWLLLLLPAGAALGAVGGLLARDGEASVPHPRRAFIVASVAGVAILAASLPAALAVSSPGSVLPTTPAPSDQQVAEKPPTPERAAPNETTAEEPAPEDQPSAPPKPETVAERPDAPEAGTGAPEAGTDVAGLLAQEGEDAGDYVTVTDDTGALSAEVPSAWGQIIVGAESEEGGSWSTFAGTTGSASITAAPDLAAWSNVTGASGTYMVASRGLAQYYDDSELVALGPNDVSGACELGARSDFSRPPYSGVVQAWKNCGGDPAASFVTLAAAPSDRACVVLMQVGMASEADIEAGQHIIDTFEADCGSIEEGLLLEQYTP